MRMFTLLVACALGAPGFAASAQGTGGPAGNANAANGNLATQPPGLNSAGTAQSSDNRSQQTTGQSQAGPATSDDSKLNSENQSVDRKIQSICRGC
jgi:hypothetical protein